tara:strand:+ start:247 stop:600 length:354 start_codon:yes stop_codon:yes gene_type:complete
MVSLGAVLGAWLRFIVSNYFHKQGAIDYLGTFVVNVCSCLVFGLVVGFTERCDCSNLILLCLGVGFVGSFSTFSTFIVELLLLIRRRRFLPAILLGIMSLSLASVAGVSGYRIFIHE